MNQGYSQFTVVILPGEGRAGNFIGGGHYLFESA